MQVATMPFAEFVEINPRVSLQRGRECEFVEMADIAPGRRYVRASSTRVAGGSGSKFMSGDTLMARITPCLENGKIAQFKGESSAAALGSTEFWVFRAKPNISDPAFVFYLANSRIIRGPAEQSMFGASGRQRADIDSVRDVEVRSFTLAEQRRIASILSAYDDLIENNTRRIAILEEMARRIYEEWFVHFRFPGHEHARMVESELGPVPDGWQRTTLRDIARVNQRSIKRGGEPDQIVYVDISSVSTGSIDKREPMPFAEAPGRARRIVGDGDIIWACVRPNRKSFSLVLEPEENLVVSTGFAVLSAESVPWTFLYQAVTTETFVSYLVNHATGAAYPAVGAADFENADVLVPDNAVLRAFNDIVEPMARLISKLRQKNTNLRTTRDLLLPKLISGELDVSALPEPEAVAA